ncbi:septum formation initiator family protein [Savagea sp. SN6]|uniref:Septum formation initiator family protein n=1 Tax=Savagea serpentis TaxID=2785297 RepID=A0A8J7KFH4_9BACL|nr:septum formation initiator family protein [Savagea serpentis]MBF4502286.1 septum formation initiator family protein [Savagea serpentis]
MRDEQTVYFQSDEQEEAYKEKRKWRLQQKKRLRRRFFFYACIASLTFITIFSIYLQQGKAQERYLADKAELSVELEKVQEEQEQLKAELERLDDDEYIEKLARQQYLIGKEGEVIFSLPEKEKKQQKE